MLSDNDTESLSALVTVDVIESVTDTESEKFFILIAATMLSVTDIESEKDLV